jgi:hypothetical protein
VTCSSCASRLTVESGGSEDDWNVVGPAMLAAGAPVTPLATGRYPVFALQLSA